MNLNLESVPAGLPEDDRIDYILLEDGEGQPGGGGGGEGESSLIVLTESSSSQLYHPPSPSATSAASHMIQQGILPSSSVIPPAHSLTLEPTSTTFFSSTNSSSFPSTRQIPSSVTGSSSDSHYAHSIPTPPDSAPLVEADSNGATAILGQDKLTERMTGETRTLHEIEPSGSSLGPDTECKEDAVGSSSLLQDHSQRT